VREANGSNHCADPAFEATEPPRKRRSREGKRVEGMPALILVVDDDPDIRALVHMILEEEGYVVMAAGDGREALAQVQQQQPSLILLDLNMPVMSGWELHDELRSREIGVPVVYMTAAQRARAEAELHGAQGFLAKPFGLHELLQTVEQFVA